MEILFKNHQNYDFLRLTERKTETEKVN